MNRTLYLALAVVVMAAVTYLPRALPLTLLRRPVKSRFLRSFLYYMPFAVLGAMTFPAILTATANIWSAAIGFAIALILAWNRKSLICVSLFSCAGVFLVELLTGL